MEQIIAFGLFGSLGLLVGPLVAEIWSRIPTTTCGCDYSVLYKLRFSSLQAKVLRMHAHVQQHCSFKLLKLWCFIRQTDKKCPAFWWKQVLSWLSPIFYWIAVQRWSKPTILGKMQTIKVNWKTKMNDNVQVGCLFSKWSIFLIAIVSIFHRVNKSMPLQKVTQL